MNMAQAVGLRSLILQNKAMGVAQKLQINDVQRRFHAQYEKGKGALSMAQEYQMPPMAVFRAILTARLREQSSSQSKEAVKRKIKTMLQNAEERLSERDRAELEQCEAHDIITTSDQQAIQLHAAEFESAVCDVLRSSGATFQTEQEQKATGRMGEATPDLLLNPPHRIQGQDVFWIDAKDYFGSSLTGIQMKGMLRQIERYEACFGRGAVVFSLGYAEDVRVTAWHHGAVLLSMQDLVQSHTGKHPN